TFDLSARPGGGTRLGVFMKSGSGGSPWLDNRLLRTGLKTLYIADYRRLGRMIGQE
ncbi:MAG: hypothetical protein HYZ26_00005, partial [Chloroflexi bacterium]|nr:hypothetical protein [Chloroflexota bacterium]